jgi:hypothetical protein
VAEARFPLWSRGTVRVTKKTVTTLNQARVGGCLWAVGKVSTAMPTLIPDSRADFCIERSPRTCCLLQRRRPERIMIVLVMFVKKQGVAPALREFSFRSCVKIWCWAVARKKNRRQSRQMTVEEKTKAQRVEVEQTHPCLGARVMAKGHLALKIVNEARTRHIELLTGVPLPRLVHDRCGQKF